MERDMKVAGRARRVGRRGGVVAAVIVVICGGLAVPVLAFVSRSVHTVVVPSLQFSDNSKSARASCPRGSHVQFGGFDSSRLAVRGIRRTADNQWTVDGLVGAWGDAPRGGSPFSGRVTSIAYCTSGPVPFKVAHATRVDSVGSATVVCPAGRVVVAGGFATSSRSGVLIRALERIAPRRWRVQVERPRRGPIVRPRMILTAVAYCGTGPPPTLVSARFGPGSVVPKGWNPRTVVASCPAGTSLVFGGVAASRAGVTAMKAPRSNGNSWRAIGYVDVDAGGYLTALAYCR